MLNSSCRGGAINAALFVYLSECTTSVSKPIASASQPGLCFQDKASDSSSAEPSQAPLSLGCAAQPDQQRPQQLQGCEGAVQSAQPQQADDMNPRTAAHDQLKGHHEQLEGHHEQLEWQWEQLEGHHGHCEQSEGHHQRLEGNHGQLEGHCKPQVGRHASGQSKGQEPVGPGLGAASILHHSGIPPEANTHNQTLCNLFCCPLTKV